MSRSLVTPARAFLLTALLTGCGGPDPVAPSAAAPSTPPAPLRITPAVEATLGITWATVEPRVVEGVLRLPGRFVAEPEARRACQAPTAGRLTRLVAPGDAVQAGQVVARLEAPAWRRLRLDLAEGGSDGCGGACGPVTLAQARLRDAEAHRKAIKAALATWEARLAALATLDDQVGAQSAEHGEAATEIAEHRAALAEVEARLVHLAHEVAGPDGSRERGLAVQRWQQLLAEASVLTGLTSAELQTVDAAGAPRWSTLDALEIRAPHAGIVETDVVADGAWVEALTPLLTITDPTRVRLDALALQGDLPRLVGRTRGRVVAADPGVALDLPARVGLAPAADPLTRAVTLWATPEASVPAWVRPGVVASLEVVVSGSPEPELAIPVAATITHGLTRVLYRRDREDPERVVQVEADLGASDGRWVAVLSGVKAGDQVVVGGIAPLTLAHAQQHGGGGGGFHVHADGTVHQDSH